MCLSSIGKAKVVVFRFVDAIVDELGKIVSCFALSCTKKSAASLKTDSRRLSPIAKSPTETTFPLPRCSGFYDSLSPTQSKMGSTDVLELFRETPSIVVENPSAQRFLT
jgi:hypothetical protein